MSHSSHVRCLQDEVEPFGAFDNSEWPGWMPLAALASCAVATRDLLKPWQFMWCLAFAIFFGLKWLTWWKARRNVAHAGWRSVAYLLAWPGMDAKAFLNPGERVPSPPVRSWAAAASTTAFGAILIWTVARTIPPEEPLVRGWLGMLGLIVLLHFGIFQLLALVWQVFGVNAKPIMTKPLRSESLAEFWGKRWNLGFRQLSYDLIFKPLRPKLGVAGASLLVFVVSGLIHDLVISFPARAGYGLPTVYFTLQGLLVLFERSAIGHAIRIQNGARGWLFAVLATAAPCYWLFHPAFVRQVILPFMEIIRAI